MRARNHLVRAAVVALCVLAADVGARQGASTMRLRGRVLAEAGAPIQGAVIRTDATAGIGGSQFVGQRQFTTKTDKKGQWSLLGITRGLWIFEATAEGYLPHVVAIPVAMMQATTLAMLPWRLSVALQSDAEVGTIAEPLGKVAKATAAGERDEAVALLQEIPLEGLSPEALCALGDASLLLRDYARAREVFTRAAQARPDWYRPYLGVGSAAMLQGDYDAAAKAYWQVRETAKDAELQQTMSAAIADLNLIAGIR